MSTIDKISGAYKGGSPRIQKPTSKITLLPKDLHGASASMYVGVVQGLYLNNQISSEDIYHLCNFLGKLKINLPPSLPDNVSNYISLISNPILEMYKGGGVNEDFLSNLISRFTSILELTPHPTIQKTIKETLSVGDSIKNQGRIQTSNKKSTIDTSIKTPQLGEIVKVIDKKYIHCELTVQDLTSFINYLQHLNGGDKPITLLPQLLVSTLVYIGGLYNDSKLTDSNLAYLIASFQNTLELPQIEKPTKTIKDKVSAISNGYKK